MKIAHITDLHLRCALPGTAAISTRLSRAMPDRLAAALALIRTEEPDLLAITGDLLDFPLDEMDEPRRIEEGLADLRLIAEMLEHVPCPIAVVPGNHDHPDLVAEVFGDLPFDVERAGYRVLSFWDEEVDGHVPMREGDDYMRFHDALLDPHTPPQIHLQHYVVWPRLNDDYPHTYGDGEAMMDAITGSRVVRLVLSGHYHQGVPLFRLGPTYFATARAFCEPPHPFTIYSLDDERVYAKEVEVRA